MGTAVNPEPERAAQTRLVLRIWELHGESAYRTAYGILGNESDSQDATQNVFLYLLRKPSSLRKVSSTEAWLHRAASNAAVAVLRSRARQRRSDGAAARRSLQTMHKVEGQGETREATARLRRFVADLPEKLRLAIVLHYFQGFSCKEMAEALLCSVSTATTRLERARGKLRDRLARAGFTAAIPLDLALSGMTASMPPRVAEGVTSRLRSPHGSSSPAWSPPSLISLPLAAGGGVALVAVACAAWAFWIGPLEQAASSRQMAQSPQPERSVANTEELPRSVEGGREARAGQTDEAESLGPLEGTDGAEMALQIPEQELTGVVVDAYDQPVGGAKVGTLLRRPGDVESFAHFHEREAGPGTRSATDGTFAIRLEPFQVVDLHVEARGHAQTYVGRVNAGEEVRVVLDTPGTLEVTVVDSEERPLEGVSLGLWLNGPEDRLGEVDRRKGRTGAEGHHVWSDLGSGTGWIWAYDSDRGGTVAQFAISTGKVEMLKLILAGEARVHGTVTDAESGEPLQGARVGPLWLEEEGTMTDARGRYEIGALGLGRFSNPWLKASAVGYAKKVGTIPEGGELHFLLERGIRVTGRVVDEKGSPLSGVLAQACGVGWDSLNPEMANNGALSGQDGRFFLSGLNRSRDVHKLRLSKREYGGLVVPIDHSHAVEGCVDLGDLILPSGWRIEGLAVTQRGEPIPRALVSLARQQQGEEKEGMLLAFNPFGNHQERRRTDNVGRFRFSDISPGSYIVELRVPGTPAVREVVDLRTGRDLMDVILRVSDEVSLIIRVQDEAGAPVAGAYVSLIGFSTFTFDGSGPLYAATDSSGVAILRGLPEDLVSITVQTPTEGFLPAPRRDLVPSGQEILFILEKAVAIQGIVKASNGKPIASIQIEAKFPGLAHEPGQAFTDLGGKFSIACPPGAVADLQVATTGLRMKGVFQDEEGETRPKERIFYFGVVRGVVAPANGIEIIVRKSPMDRTVRLLAVDPLGKPVVGAAVHYYSTDYLFQGFDTPQTGEDGRVMLEGLPPVELNVTVYARGMPQDFFKRKSIQVVPAGQEVTVRFEKNLAISGMVVDRAGTPVPGVSVSVSTRTSTRTGTRTEGVAHFVTDEEGGFRLIVPGAGPWSVEASHFREDDESVTTGSVLGVVAPAESVTIRIGPP